MKRVTEVCSEWSWEHRGIVVVYTAVTELGSAAPQWTRSDQDCTQTEGGQFENSAEVIYSSSNQVFDPGMMNTWRVGTIIASVEKQRLES